MPVSIGHCELLAHNFVWKSKCLPGCSSGAEGFGKLSAITASKSALEDALPTLCIDGKVI